VTAKQSVPSDATDVERSPVATTRCRVEWIDTDGAGHYHHGTVVRWVEVVEAEFFRSLDAEGLYGRIPRVHYQVDYVSPAWFGDVVEVELFVDLIGTSSLAMSFEARLAAVVIARGSHTIVHVDDATGRSAPWPPELRTRMSEAARGS
jgi:acyl-CoA thioester hydrolase